MEALPHFQCLVVLRCKITFFLIQKSITFGLKMGVINKIRQRAGLVVGSVAVAMVLFLLGGDLLSPTSVLLRGRREVGQRGQKRKQNL